MLPILNIIPTYIKSEHYPCYVLNIIPTSNSHLTALIRAILKNEHYPYWGIRPISKMNIIPTKQLYLPNPTENTIYSGKQSLSNYIWGLSLLTTLEDHHRKFWWHVGLSVFQSAEGAFSVEMWNRNALKSDSKAEDTQEEDGGNNSSKIKESIYSFVKAKGEASRKEIENEFHMGSTKAFKLLKLLCADGLLAQKLKGNKTTYVVL